MIPVLRSDNCFSAVMIQVKNLDQLSIPGAGTQSSDEIVEKLTCFYTKLDLGQKANLKAVPNNECAKIVFQFADQRSSTASRTAPALLDILPCPREIIVKERSKSKKSSVSKEASDAGVSEKKITLVEKGDVLWMLGLDGFAHLFQGQTGSFFQRQTGYNILSNLNFILSGARDYVNAIPPQMTPLFTPSQNEREGIRNLLNTSLPLKSTDYLALQDCSFKEAYPTHSAKLIRTKQNFKLSAATKNLEFTVGGVVVAKKEVESATSSSSSPKNRQEPDSIKEKKRLAADSDEANEQPAISRQRRN